MNEQYLVVCLTADGNNFRSQSGFTFLIDAFNTLQLHGFDKITLSSADIHLDEKHSVQSLLIAGDDSSPNTSFLPNNRTRNVYGIVSFNKTGLVKNVVSMSATLNETQLLRLYLLKSDGTQIPLTSLDRTKESVVVLKLFRNAHDG